MASLTTCIKKGKNLNEQDVADIKEMAQSLIGEGNSPQESALEAIAAQIESLLDDRQGLLDQADVALPAPELPAFSKYMNPPAKADVAQDNSKSAINGDLDRVDPAVRDAVNSAISRETKAEAKRIRRNLERLKGTPWAVTAIKGLAVREFFHLAAAKQADSERAQAILDSEIWGEFAGPKMRANQFIRAALEGTWKSMVVGYKDWISDNRKAEKAISTSMKNCDPSKDCADHCYAARGRLAAPYAVIKSEATEWAVDNHFEDLVNNLERNYRASALGQAGLALRLNDKGDLSKGQVKLVNEMGKRGIRMQIFSKRPELLDQIDEFHLRMLSIDGSNLDVAQGNDHLLAITVTNSLRDDDLAPLAERAAVILPVNLQGAEWSPQELKAGWPKSYPKFKNAICPVEAGLTDVAKGGTFVTITDPRVDTGNIWTCPSCNKRGAVGCFHGDRQGLVQKFELLASDNSDTQADIDLINDIAQNLDSLVQAGGITDEQRKRILEEIRAGGPAISGIADALSTQSTREEYSEGVLGAESPGFKARQNQLGFAFGFTLKEDPYEGTETRPDTTEEQKEVGRSLMDDFLRRIEAGYRDKSNGNLRITTLASNFIRNLQTGKAGDIIGSKVTSTYDLALAAQAYRDPRFETQRLFLVKDQQIVEERAITNRLPGSVDYGTLAMFGDLPEHDTAYLLHNHPTGTSTPSKADIKSTKNIAQIGYLPKLAAHVVIDHDEYSTITGDGATTRHADVPTLQGRDWLQDAEKPSDYLNRQIQDIDSIVQVGQELTADTSHAVVLITDAQLHITQAHSVPLEMIESLRHDRLGKRKVAGILRAIMKHTGSGGYLHLALPDGLNPKDFAWASLHGGFKTITSGTEYYMRTTLQRMPGSKPSPQFLRLREEVEEITLSVDKNRLGMYSPLQKTVLDMKLPGFVPSKKNPEGRARAADIKAKIANSGLKKEELEWTGILEMLEAEPDRRYTREELNDLVRENMVVLDQADQSDTMKAADEPRFDLNEAVSLKMDESVDALSTWVRDQYIANDHTPNDIMEDAIRLWWKEDRASFNEVLDEEKIDRSLGDDHFVGIFHDNSISSQYIPDEYVRRASREWMDKGESPDFQVFELQQDPAYHYDGDDEWGYVIYTAHGFALGWVRSAAEAELRLRRAAEMDGIVEPSDATAWNTMWGNYTLEGDQDAYHELKITFPNREGRTFSSEPHFAEDNILGFVRATSRGSTFFVEELQSDWHQKGRDKGYETPEIAQERREKRRAQVATSQAAKEAYNRINEHGPAVYQALEMHDPTDLDDQLELQRAVGKFLYRLIQAVHSTYDVNDKIVRRAARPSFPAALVKSAELPGDLVDAITADLAAYAAAKDQEIRASQEYRAIPKSLTPNAPFKNDAWINLLAKRAIIEAVRLGHTELSWMTGPLMNERWSAAHAELYTNVYDRKLVKAIAKATGQKPTKTTLSTMRGDAGSPDTPYLIHVPTGDSYHWTQIVGDIGIKNLDQVGERDRQLAIGAKARIDGRDPADYQWTTFGELPENRAEAWTVPITEELVAQVEGRGLPMFREGDTTPSGRLSVMDVQKIVDTMPENLADNVTVVPDITALPTGLRRTVERMGASPTGVYMRDSGEVFIVASAMKNRRDVEATFLHETVGHRGLSRVLNRQGEIDFLRLVSQARDADPVIQEAYEYVNRVYDGASDIIKAAEVVAKIAEDDPKHTLVQRVVQFFRQLLRRLGFRVAFTNNDIIEMLRRAKQSVAGQETQSGDEFFRQEDSDVTEPSSSNILLREATADRDDRNRRMREQHKTVFERGRDMARRYFAPGGLLPREVFEEKIKRDSQIEAGEMDTKHRVLALERAVQSGMGKKFNDLSVEERRMVDQAVRGAASPELPDGVAAAAEAMRQHVDRLSERYIGVLVREFEAMRDTGEFTDEQLQAKLDLMETIAGNQGEYLHRSYQAYDDPAWPKKIPDTLMDATREYLLERTDGDALRAERILADILKVGTAFDSMEAYIKESKLGAKDLSVLKKRKDIAPEIRAILGEYQDPRLNYARTVAKMNRLIYNSLFLERVRDLGEGAFLFEDGDHPPDAYVTIAAEGSESYSPLNGLRTYPEFNQAMIDALGKEQMPNWYRTMIQWNGMVKFGKTVLSPTTAMRNFMSAFFFTAANGHFNQAKLIQAVKASGTYWKDRGGHQAYLRRLKELGVIYDTPYAGEMMRLLDDAQLTEKFITGRASGKTALDWAQKFYRWGDDFWKIVGFENEVQLQMKHYGRDRESAMEESAKRIRDTYPTYSMVGRIIQSLRRLPVAGTFVSFPAEIIRTSINMFRYMAEDFRQSPTLGLRRAAGLAFVGGFAYAAQEMWKDSLDVDEEEEEAIRRQLAPWNRNSNLLFLSREDGNLRYLDLSFLDPYNYWKRPVTAMMRNQPWEDSATQALGEMLKPFLGEDIAFQAIREIVSNQKTSGSPVYREVDDPVDQAADIATHLWKAVRPGITANYDRLSKALQGERSRTGREYSVDDELMALAGFRVSTLNPSTSLEFRAYDARDRLTQSRSRLKRAATDPNPVKDSDLVEELNKSVEARYAVYEEMIGLAESAKRTGLSVGEVTRALQAGGLSKRDSFAVAHGRVPPSNLGSQWMAKNIRSAQDRYGAQWRKEFLRRRNMLRKLYYEKWNEKRGVSD